MCSTLTLLAAGSWQPAVMRVQRAGEFTATRQMLYVRYVAVVECAATSTQPVIIPGRESLSSTNRGSFTCVHPCINQLAGNDCCVLWHILATPHPRRRQRELTELVLRLRRTLQPHITRKKEEVRGLLWHFCGIRALCMQIACWLTLAGSA